MLWVRVLNYFFPIMSNLLAVSEASFPSLFKIAAAAMVLRHKLLVHPGSFDQFAPS